MKRLVKTFVEHRYYRPATPGVFVEIPKAETQEGPSIDVQIATWVNATGNIIIHPGQLGMHTTWHGDAKDPYQLKCLTIGLTVLYQEAEHGRQPLTQHADPAGFDPGASAIQPGADDPRRWGDHQRAADRPGGAYEETRRQEEIGE